MDKRLIVRYVVRETMGLVILGVALFWSAGTLTWWAGWATLAVILAWTAATAIVILRTNPALLAERLGPRVGAKSWDTAILGLLGVTQLARYVLAGFDYRLGWTGAFPLAVQLAGLGLSVAGYALVVWATASNSFFSQVVRIQSERGHVVARGGPYRTVRHPAYSGAILYELAVPFLLSSWWALLAGVLGAILLFVRTALEDRTLLAELEGYRAYAGAVRFRLVPGIW